MGNTKMFKFNCKKCGKLHSYNECPAYKKNCNICAYKKHFAAMCNNKNIRKSKQVNTVLENNETYEYLSLDEVEIRSNSNT